MQLKDLQRNAGSGKTSGTITLHTVREELLNTESGCMSLSADKFHFVDTSVEIITFALSFFLVWVCG